MDAEQFEALVEQALDSLPPEIDAALDNLVIIIQDWPSREQMQDNDIRNRYGILGLYEGVALPDRGVGYNMVAPDKITIFQRPLESLALPPSTRPSRRSARPCSMRLPITSASQTMTSTNWGMARGPTLTALRRRLLAWYRIHGRDLPWRKSDDPYHALVAEFMLQQTGVGRVLPAFASFLQRFPTLQSLASAPTSDVIRAWSGLGYNRRAVNLQRTARVIVEEHDGIIPRDPRTLATLPGIGPYTAAAIACFAFQRPVAVMDTNIRRVLGRILTGHTEVDADTGWALAEVAAPARWQTSI